MWRATWKLDRVVDFFSLVLHIVSWMMRFICANLVSRVCLRLRGLGFQVSFGGAGVGKPFLLFEVPWGELQHTGPDLRGHSRAWAQP